MAVDVCDQAGQPFDNLRVSLLDVVHGAGAEIDLELEAMKRMTPREHLRMDERVGAFADSRNMRVIVNQTRRINIIE